MDAGRSVNSTFSVANLLDGAGAGMEYLRIGGRSAGSSQSGRHAYSETHPAKYFFFIFYGKVQIIF